MTRIAAIAIAAGLIALAPPAHADPDDDTSKEVCGAYNLGVPQDQIPDRLHANDHRINEWQAQRDTNWPIINGDCG